MTDATAITSISSMSSLTFFNIASMLSLLQFSALTGDISKQKMLNTNSNCIVCSLLSFLILFFSPVLFVPLRTGGVPPMHHSNWKSREAILWSSLLPILCISLWIMNLYRPWGWRSIFEKSFKNHLKSLNKSIFLLGTQCSFSIDVSWDSSTYHPEEKMCNSGKQDSRLFCTVLPNVYILRFESGAWGGRRGESDLGDSLLKTKAGKLATEAWTLTWMGDSLRGNEEEGWRLSAIILQWSWTSLKEQFQKNPPVTGHASILSVATLQ